MICRSRLLWIAPLFLVASAFGVDTIQGGLLVKDPVIDGIPTPAKWQGAARIESLRDTSTGDPCPEGSIILFGFTKEAVYVAGILRDSKPGEITAREYRFNGNIDTDDNVQITLDPSGNQSSVNRFGVNPAGAATVNLWTGAAVKREWAGEIEVKTHRDEHGWTFEMKLPWKLFGAMKAGDKTWSIYAVRHLQRLQRDYADTYAAGQSLRFREWRGMVAPEVKPQATLRTLAYGYTGIQDAQNLANAGADFKYDQGSTHALVTINPDNRNIQNQIKALSTSHFDTIAGESRPFFAVSPIQTDLFTPQQVLTFNRGIKFFGSPSPKATYSFLVAQNGGVDQSSVYTYRYRFDPTASMRVAMTDYTSPSYSNDAFQISGSKEYKTCGIYVDQRLTRDSSLGRGDFSNRTFYGSDKKGIHSFYAGERRITPTYNGRLSFNPEIDVNGAYWGYNYNPSFPKGTLRNYFFSYNREAYRRNSGDPYRNNSSFSGGATFRNSVALNGTIYKEDFDGSPGRSLSLGATFPEQDSFHQVSYNFTRGIQTGYDYTTHNVSVAYRFGKSFDLGASYQYQDFGGRSTQGIYSATYDLKHDQLLTARILTQNEHTGGYVSYKRAGGLGKEYYLILGDPNQAAFRPSIVFKLVVPFSSTFGHA